MLNLHHTLISLVIGTPCRYCVRVFVFAWLRIRDEKRSAKSAVSTQHQADAKHTQQQQYKTNTAAAPTAPRQRTWSRLATVVCAMFVSASTVKNAVCGVTSTCGNATNSAKRVSQKAMRSRGWRSVRSCLVRGVEWVGWLGVSPIGLMRFECVCVSASFWRAFGVGLAGVLHWETPTTQLTTHQLSTIHQPPPNTPNALHNNPPIVAIMSHAEEHLRLALVDVEADGADAPRAHAVEQRV